ncbi:hypothetical protein QNI19_16615 [Cytophagaceae bacterium DM2B3-1]|uniref:Uncharacterized protein n=1 Tax=Xanthocytophaga flava TaxID=3048013 RepID=A0ABT7CNI5_9BACT|nr:hypothetical protein [Xanthocytophaga flavus]MDJ1468203.1 hypothetical protein [Xanthocytophaga flavus]MDJ1494570.1 hypothetical protein [Xanthocytophaga flavus]
MIKYLKQTFVTKEDKKIGYLFLYLFLLYLTVILSVTLDLHQNMTVTKGFNFFIALGVASIPVFPFDLYVLNTQNERIKLILTIPCLVFTLLTLFVDGMLLIGLSWLLFLDS